MLNQFISKSIAAILIVVFAFATFVPAAQAAGKDQPAANPAFSITGKKDDAKTIVEVVLATNAESGEFSILIAALQAADPAVIERLASKKRSTVFAPTDAAFEALLQELGLTAEELLNDQALVTDVLLYHVARGKRDSEDVLNSRRIRTLQGQYLYQDQGVLTDANGRTANIVAVDIKASNGVIHVIDRVVLPLDKNIVDVVLAANAESGEFSILIAALQAADPAVIERLASKKRSTVFAPTDAAFQALLEELGLTAEELLSDQALVTDVLKYHIARGYRDSVGVLKSRRIPTLLGQYLYQDQGILTDANGRTANLVTVDIKASNGIIHVIDRVVLPLDKNIVDVVLAANAESGEFSILIAALQAADPAVLERLASNKRQSTVFAPTDAAFESALEEFGITAEELLSNQALLTQVLLYHVASGNRDSVDVLNSKRIPTLQGQYLYQDGGVLTDANGRTANIVAVDIKASNGIIHVIDRVVLPKP